MYPEFKAPHTARGYGWTYGRRKFLSLTVTATTITTSPEQEPPVRIIRERDYRELLRLARKGREYETRGG